MKRFTLTAMTVTAALALYLTAASPLPLFAAALLLVLGLLGEKVTIPLPVIVVCALTALLGTFFLRPETPRLSGFLFEPALSLSAGLFSCLGSALLLIRRNPAWEELLVPGTSLVTLLIAGNTTYTMPFAPMVALYTLFLVSYLRCRSFGLKLSSVGPFSLLIALGLGLCLILSGSERSLGSVLSFFKPWSASINFGNTAGIRPQKDAGGDKVLLRVFSKQPENYLAARRYVNYHNQKWETPESKPVESTSHRTFGNESSYELRGPVETSWTADQLGRVELNSLSPETLPAPLSGRLLQAPVDSAELNSCGDLLVQVGWRFKGTYQFALGDLPIEESEELLQQCLEAEVDPSVSALATEIAGERDEKLKVFALQKFFQENFEYGFGYPFDRAKDPVAQFLKERPPAHCEVFATSMTLMLRTVGVPARYVQGFLVREHNDWGDYWVSRERDAHAWVEVYIQGVGWMTVDPTPPGVSAPVDPPSSWSEFADMLKRQLQRAWAFVARGPSAMARDLLQFSKAHPLAMSFILVTLLAWRFRSRLFHLRVRPEDSPTVPAHQRVQQLQSLLSEFETSVGQTRPEALTLLEWADIQEHKQAQKFLEHYSEVRYKSAVPDEESLQSVKSSLAQVQSTLPETETA